MKDWFKNDSFWSETYSYMFSKQRFLEAEEQIDKFIDLVDINGSSVLDLCCGPGRWSVALAKRHYNVTGIDRTAFLLDKAKQRADHENVKIEWIQEDMRDFVRNEGFDLILCAFTSFGYFDNRDEDVKVLKNMFNSLKPQGSCIIDLISKETLARIFKPTLSDSLDDGTLVVQRNQIIDDWSRVKTQWLLIKNKKVKNFHFFLNLYSGQELKEQLQSVGFQEIKLYGNINGDPYDNRAERLIITGKKLN